MGIWLSHQLIVIPLFGLLFLFHSNVVTMEAAMFIECAHGLVQGWSGHNRFFKDSLDPSQEALGLLPRISSLSLAARLNGGDLKSRDIGTCHFLPRDKEAEMKDGENRFSQFSTLL